ncbi:Rap1a/Tai family immunity protein [Kaarinaea lacus]
MCLLCATPAQADLQTISNGKSLVISCLHALKILNKDLDPIPPEIQTNAFICFSYISGVLGGARYMETLGELRYAQGTAAIQGNVPPFRKSCIDWNIQYQKAAKIVLAYARQNPDELSQDAHGLVLRALNHTYPCPGQPSPGPQQ